MSKIAIVGAGHAGVEAAFALANAGNEVTLYTNEPELPYFRPRLIAVAFGQAEPDGIRIKPAAMYEKAGIHIVHEAVTALDLSARTVQGVAYEGIVLTQGSTPFVPPFKGENTARIRTLWTMADARALRDVAHPGSRLTIIGGGVLGLEAALRAVLAGVKVTVVEVSPALVGGVLGNAAERVLRETLLAKGITLHLGVSIATIDAHSLTLSDGTVIEDDAILCSAGARPQVALAETAGVQPDFGLRTQPNLSLVPGVYAAGDLARPTEARPVCAVRRAMMMGALAAKNLMAELADQPTSPWIDPTLPLFMKVEEVEFHTLGDVRSPDLVEQRIDDGTDPRIWKSVLYRGEQPVGLRFVGTRAGFGEWEKKLV